MPKTISEINVIYFRNSKPIYSIHLFHLYNDIENQPQFRPLALHKYEKYATTKIYDVITSRAIARNFNTNRHGASHALQTT